MTSDPNYPGSRLWVAKRFEQIWEEIQNLRSEGQKEYAHDENNAFANFERTADRSAINRFQAIWTFTGKHFDGISAWIIGHRSQREDVRGRIKDLIVYLLLLHCMIDQEESEFKAIEKGG